MATATARNNTTMIAEQRGAAARSPNAGADRAQFASFDQTRCPIDPRMATTPRCQMVLDAAMKSDDSEPDPPAEDDPMQTLIGKQLRSLYDSVLAEPIPDHLSELLAKLDEIPVPKKSGESGEDSAQQ